MFVGSLLGLLRQVGRVCGVTGVPCVQIVQLQTSKFRGTGRGLVPFQVFLAASADLHEGSVVGGFG
eukprot:8219926-Lingulodinium_polyedra.AAC.1